MFLNRAFVCFLFFSTSIGAKSPSQTYAVLLLQGKEANQNTDENETADFHPSQLPHHRQRQVSRIIKNMSWIFSTWVIGGNILLFIFSDSRDKIKKLQRLIDEIDHGCSQYEIIRKNQSNLIEKEAIKVIMELRSHFQFSWFIPGSRQVIGLPRLLEALKQLSGLEIAESFNESTKEVLRDILNLAKIEEKPWYIESWASLFMPSLFTEGERTYF